MPVFWKMADSFVTCNKFTIVNTVPYAETVVIRFNRLDLCLFVSCGLWPGILVAAMDLFCFYAEEDYC